ncbi:penicillin-binding transpeptidase domain-containing protein [Bacillus sp. AGMB 02131]|uniref:serine-type D-Ala-D-Ala carboxypeptidase n=1 Tax=Peribacillus faecalis TaxID=2772559 RepID=A0A927CTZ2_9BACI|nr:penicillin-binding transpeptidase domain-containing protein [Peribacillus faecalis]
MKRYLFTFIFFILILMLTSCSEEPIPEERFESFVKLWGEQKFEEMYDYLSVDGKDKIKKEEFIERYSKIYKDLEVENLEISFNKPNEPSDSNVDQVEYDFSVKMETIAGPITFDNKAVLLKEEREEKSDWYINWNTTFIFKELEEEDKIGINSTKAERGQIFDVNGQGLAVNGIVYEIGIVPGNMGENEEEIKNQLSELLDIRIERIEELLNASWVQPEHFVPIKKISVQDEELLNKLLAIESVTKKDVTARVYPFGEAASHLIGYVGTITAEEIEKRDGKGYLSTDVIGKRGLEQVLEERLKGEHGVKVYIKKADGSEELLAEKEVIHGEDIQLTINGELQTKIFNELKGEAGAAVAIHPITGETHALVSSPGFDPNTLSLGASASQWEKIEQDTQNPLLNRFKSTFAPGSVFKPITAAIGLKNGTISEADGINISGLKWQKNDSWGSYYVTRVKEANESINLEKALMYSDNIYFAQKVLELGTAKFTEGLKEFGFNEDIPFSYPIEKSTFGEIESEVLLADSSYGQGQIEMSVFHLAAIYTTFVNQGKMIKPILFSEEERNQVWNDSLINEEQTARINAALKEVVENPSGTAYSSARVEGYPIAGKTGTAELKEKQGEQGTENGWFVAYNTENPNLLVALMVEGVQGRGGSSIASEKVKNIFTYDKQFAR